MFGFIKCDFSKEAKFKDKLFLKMKYAYEKSKREVIELSDDDLDSISAAANKPEICPFIDRKCKKCENYIESNSKTNCCRINYTKNS
ncbi:hypothetical protein JMF89_07165 [Clostridiaceae bacterium UIB06]|uniref:Uncharacterized protein n=1 Tax=Clostridium thailandense TaxID=2794346 RepID=A0A949TND8_9CLOT|nr:hypothetical protein [Clostridium thailandense]MBV7272457.1 hypothetical protein [Clostridium thailandense]MCH5136981.1 hypothetical protein [Clostridiaceae bacterium UIB06]